MNSSKAPTFLEQQFVELSSLVTSLKNASTYLEKISFLDTLPLVKTYLKEPSPIRTFLAGINPECEYAIKSIIAIGQAPIVFNMQGAQANKFELLRELLEDLRELENFYQDLGGIIGYHLTLIEKIINKRQTENDLDAFSTSYIHPEGIHLDQNTREVRQAVRWGLENLEKLAEIYPVGGAGDRLNLIDPLTQTPLPAAILTFTGRTLLEGLIRDIQAREYLHFKLYGQQLITPIAMMTSTEKNNHIHIVNICKAFNWFGRPIESFYLFVQPLVPVINIEGNWSLSACLKLTLKPGGHGVIWKLAEEKGVFNWLEKQGRQKALVRQINNPIAGTDHALLALAGLGCHKNKAFGFISCERLLNSAEGINVLIEKSNKNNFNYCVTNIEYTEFAQKHIGEIPLKPGSPYSLYPTNTNILFADLNSVRQALHKGSLPGQIINLKTKFPYRDALGNLSYVEGSRLETTMQNIADYLEDTFPYKLKAEDFKEALRTFIIYNLRHKTISTTKKSYVQGESIVGTPEQAYYDLLNNNINLLKTYCDFIMPDLGTIEDYLKQGPKCIVLYHPALGPLYSVIAQKIRKGRLAKGSELQLEIAEADIYDLDLEGSLIVEATSPLGAIGSADLLHYGKESRCYLHHVRIHNKGINRQLSNSFWKNDIIEREALQLLLQEGAEFYAENVTFTGNMIFKIPAYHRLTIRQNQEGELIQDLQKISQPSWYWEYSFDADDQIQLNRK